MEAGKSGSTAAATARARARARAGAGARADAAGEPGHAVEDIPGLDELADALLSLRSREECRRFLRDLCTLGELEAVVHRWQIARLLEQGNSYLEISERVHTSTATVTRVAHWLRHGTGGYAIALRRSRPAKGA
jgi:TrpR-related protein YerC/YecD